MKMPSIYDIIKNKKYVVIILLLIHFITFIISLIMMNIVGLDFDGGILVFVLLQLILLVIPFILVILYMTDTKLYRVLSKQIWFKFLLFIVVSIYIIISNNYASTMINEVFKVDSNYFINTKMILTFTYILNIFEYVYLIIYTLSYAIIPMIIFTLFIFRKYKILIYLFATILYFVFVSGFSVSTEKNMKKYIPIMTNRLDFNKYHVCSNIYDTKGFLGLVYLQNNKALTSYLISDNGEVKIKYMIQECDYLGKIN